MEAFAGIVAIGDIDLLVDVGVGVDVVEWSSLEKFKRIISGCGVEATNTSEILGHVEI